MAERARLESVCTGNRTAGSNPALSASLYGFMRSRNLRPSPASVPAQPRRGRVRTRGGWAGGRCAGARVRPRGGAGGRRDAGALAPATARGGLGGRLPALPPSPVDDARNPALSASPIASVGGGPERRGRGGKQGARVPRDGAPRTSSGPEGSSDKGNATGAAVPPGSLLRHGGMRQGSGLRCPGSGEDEGAALGPPATDHRPRPTVRT